MINLERIEITFQAYFRFLLLQELVLVPKDPRRSLSLYRR